MRVNFQEWLPDLPPNDNPGATVAENVIPFINSYQPFKDLVPFSNALPGRPLGAISAIRNDRTVYMFAGTSTGLYRLDGSSWTDVSRVGGYSTADGEIWRFAQYGNKVLATNYTNEIQVIDLATGNFANLAGSPPKARYITVVNGFVFLGNVDESGAKPFRVRWSDLENETNWAIGSGSSQSDFQDFVDDGGIIINVVGGTEYAVVIRERAIHRFQYVGAPNIFTNDKIESSKGSPVPSSVVPVERSTYYLGQEGFYRFNGQFSEPIGDNKVDKTFYRDVNQTFFNQRMSGVSDPINKLILWAYPSNDSPDGDSNKILIYNYAIQRWSIVNLSTRLFFGALQPGYTLETLDTYGASSSIDTLPFSLDSRVWKGGSNILAAFDNQNRLCYFTGSNLAATVDSGETQVNAGAKSFLSSVRPIVNSNNAVISVGYRDRIGNSITYSGDVSQNDNGECDFRIAARYHRVRVKLPYNDSWSEIQGFDFNATQDGLR